MIQGGALGTAPAEQSNNGQQEENNPKLKANKGWMFNIDKMDNDENKADGWLKADILYQQFPGLKKEISGVTTKYMEGSIFFKSDEMARFITDNY